METRANFVLIGAFTLAVVAAALGFVLWFQSAHSVSKRSPIRFVFEGSASGLRNGASVNFNGIRVGEVTSVALDNPRRVVAVAMVENSAPIRKDTLVGLEFQGLTGVSAIALRGGAESAPPAPVGSDGVRVLKADPEALQDISEAVRATLRNVNRIVADNQEALKNSLTSVEAFTASLARNSERIDSILLKVDGVMARADDVMAKTDDMMGGMAAITGKSGGELLLAVKSFRELTDNLDKRSAGLILDGRRTLNDISRAVVNLDRNPTRLLFGPSTSTMTPESAQPQRRR